ncbi:MAG: signal peptide peptidase SppA [Bacteroidetes bacterium GWA2_30_7]|nr:MAG: signal peptide peptidase SppA [Bacteroidetes bacterium GWA2_30_7]
MKSFFKIFFASMLAIIITGVITVLIFIGIFASLVSSVNDKPVAVKENSILKITLDNEIVDRATDNPLQNFDFMSMKSNQKLGLYDILKDIKKAKTDSNIKGIYLELSEISAGIATVEEIRTALLAFKESGKFIISYSDFYSQKAYYLASAADKVYVNPQGLVEFKGLGAELMFFKGTLEKLGVEPQIIRHGKFKSAIEPFILDKMSPANREQTITYMKSIWDNIVAGISETRKITSTELNNLADSMKIDNAAAALNYKLVDGLKYKDEIIAELQNLSGVSEKDGLRFIGLANYTKSPEKKEEGKKGLAKEKIAIIYASGEIDMGEGEDQKIGSESLSKVIRRARKDSTIKAVVFRINSPGGSALASEVIWREIDLTKKVKPVIVSMGDVAASGGYYIACPADVILADHNTITGSIGVFGVLWNGQKLMNEKLGITVDRVTTNTHSDIGSVFRPMEDAERAVIQKSVEEIYDVFITHVAEGRRIEKAQVDSIGQGRVWSGVNAKEIKLIDEFGGIERAIEIAIEKANLENYRIVELPRQKDPFQQILEQLKGDSQESAIKQYLGFSYKYYKNLNELLNLKGVQARLPYYININ